LIDGLQRTSSVLQFLDNEAVGEKPLELCGCDLLTSLNGKKFDDLETPQKLKIKRSPIRATIINKSGDQFVKYELFKRLNTGGALLSAQEIRNCSSRMIDGGEIFYEFLKEMANTENFANSIGRLPDSYREQKADEELVLRFFAVTEFREGYRGNIEEWLDNYMENIIFEREQFSIKDAREKFEATFAVIYKKLSDKGFTRFNQEGNPTGRLAPAYFEAVAASVSANLDTVNSMSSDEVLERIKNAFSDDTFKNSTGPGANTIEKLNTRIDTVSHYLN